MAAQAQQQAEADRSLLLADAERLEGLDHAGGMRLPYNVIPVNIARGDQFKPEFLTISPNNRMPAIVDPDGPGGRPISVFESGAILQYLGRKTGKFYPAGERARVAVDEWLFWQMANLGPKAGEANHFRRYAPERLPYALDRFGNEMNRLYGVMNTRLKDRRFLAGALFDRRHGLRRLDQAVRAPGRDVRRAFRISSAGSPRCARGPRSSAACTSASRRRAGSTCRTRRCARCCSGSAQDERRSSVASVDCRRASRGRLSRVGYRRANREG